MRLGFILRVLLILALVLSVLACIFLYLGYNIMTWLQVWGIDVSLTTTAMVSGIISISYFFSRIQPIPFVIRKALAWLGSFAFVWIFGLMGMLPILNVIYGLMIWLFHPLQAQTFIAWSGIVVISVLCIGTIVGMYYARKPILRKYAIKLGKPFPNGTKKLTILLASDLHIGHLVGKKHVQRLIDLSNSLKPDMIVFAGDVLDDDVRPFLEQKIYTLFRQFQAPRGVYAILGNHEYYGGGIAKYISVMDEVGIPVLLDEVVSIEGLGALIGRKDITANSFQVHPGGQGRKTLDQLLEGVDTTLPIFVLDHQPKEIRHAQRLGVDVIMSGHTHRGQIWPNHWITQRIFDLDYGYRKFGNLHAVVSSGWGTWGPPIRIGSQCEAIFLEISASK